MTTPTRIDLNSLQARWEAQGAPVLIAGHLTKAYEDGTVCRCAQGDVLHLAGISDADMQFMSMREADEATATAIGRSIPEAIMLRIFNDDARPGCAPATPRKRAIAAIAAIEKMQAASGIDAIIKRFLAHVYEMTTQQWIAICESARERVIHNHALPYTSITEQDRYKNDCWAIDVVRSALGVSNEIALEEIPDAPNSAEVEEQVNLAYETADLIAMRAACEIIAEGTIGRFYTDLIGFKQDWGITTAASYDRRDDQYT